MEYVLLGGVNDAPEDARRVVRLLSHFRTKVNLIPWNPGNLPYRAPTPESIEAFKSVPFPGEKARPRPFVQLFPRTGCFRRLRPARAD